MKKLAGFIFFLSIALSSSAQSVDSSFIAPTDLTTSLLICQPGRDFYSGFGHCALRLQCPSKGLDVTFTYALDDNVANRIAMFRGNGEGKYTAAKTTTFLEEYVREGRGVVSYPLNLGVEQTRDLWQILDEENASPAFRKYNFLHTNCSSMCFYALERVLNGEEIVWNNLTEGCTGTYRNFVKHVSAGRPWTEFFWNSILGSDGEEIGHLEDKLAPMLVKPTIGEASIRVKTTNDSIGNGTSFERPFVQGEPTKLVEHTLTFPHNPFTPVVVFAILIVVAIIVSIYEHWRGYNKIPHIFDCILLAAHTIVGLFVFYLSCISDMAGAAHNWNLLIFNPLPALLWICFRHRKWFAKVYILYCAVILFYIVSWTFKPGVELAHVLLALTLLIRSVIRVKDVKSIKQSSTLFLF